MPTKTHVARIEKRRRRRPKPGTVKQLQGALWRSVLILEEHLERVATHDRVEVSELTRLTHALAQSAGVYLKAIEVGELEERLAALEQAQEIRRAA